MTHINNVISQSTFEKALELIENPPSAWSITYTDGTRETIPKKEVLLLEEKNLHVYPFNHCYISERLKFPLLSLEPHIPLFISAQTGAGKTSLVFNGIYPQVRKKHLRLLIFVSRSALKTKVKYDAIDAAGTDQRECLTPAGIEKEHHFGDIDVYSYQDFSIETNSADHRHAIEISNYGSL